jgi:MtN3 and saliva related transmembrane protein
LNNLAANRSAAVGTNSSAIHFRIMNTAVGLFAAVCTTLSYFPQLKKCWETGSAGDLSLKMFLTLALGVATWIVYGFLQRDFVIILANAVSFCLLLGILYFKLREHRRG